MAAERAVYDKTHLIFGQLATYSLGLASLLIKLTRFLGGDPDLN